MTLLQEYISQQPALWRALLVQRKSVTEAFASAYADFFPERIMCIGSGSSHYAALMARPLLEQVWQCEVTCVVPSDFTMPRDTRRTLYLAISQSGVSTNTYEILCALREAGYPTVVITEHPEAPVGQAAALTVPLLIGEENIGAKTKGVTATALTLMLLALSVCRDQALLARTDAALEQLCAHAEQDLAAAQAWSVLHRDTVLPFRHLTVLACGAALGAAQEAALKLLETNYLPVSWYPLDEYVHGIQNALDQQTCLLCLLPAYRGERERVLRLVDFARSVGAVCLVVGSGEVADSSALVVSEIDDPALQSISYLAAIQVLAAELSAARGIDTSRRRYPDFFTMMGSKMENDACLKTH